ncbi:MAG: right-handed parallel beta-helix repeat-containing protein [Crocinitomicaceae bacterium]|nr:right-handed parallel beta-helix repeat-containing protein [Crocinitomicaceae bacterium]
MKHFWLVFLMSVFFHFTGKSNTIYIPVDLPTIQQGLDSSSYGDTVIVEPGTYTEYLIWPNIDGIKLLSEGDSTNTILMAPVNSRNILMNSSGIITNETVISGFTLSNTVYDPCDVFGGAMLMVQSSPVLEDLHFANYTFIGDGTSSTELNGLVAMTFYCSPIIKNCQFFNVTVENTYESIGSAIYIRDYSNPIISGISIRNFSIKVEAWLYGGGIYIMGNCSPQISDVYMENLTLFTPLWNYGYGIYVNDNSHPTVENLTIKQVKADSSSWSYGAIYVYGNSNPTFRHVEVSDIEVIGASRVYGEGVHVQSDCSPVFEDVWLHDFNLESTTYWHGGAIYISDSCHNMVMDGLKIENVNGMCGDDIIGTNIFIRSSNPTLKNFVIKNSFATAVHYAQGGGISLQNSASPTLENFIICNNQIEGNTGCCINRIAGAGIAFGDYSTAVLKNGLIADNLLIGQSNNCFGAGIYAAISSTPTFINCTIVNNNSIDPVAGSGVYAQFSSVPVFQNCIIRNPNAANEIDMDGGSSVTITYSNVRNGYIGQGNINANPQFSTAGCYFLSPTSPCFGSGSGVGAPIFDLDYNSRPYAGNTNPSMGAYELGQGNFLGNDTTICDTLPITIAPVSYGSYEWTPLVVDSSGTYVVSGTKGCCTTTDTINVNFLPPIPNVDLGPDTATCDYLVLDAGANYDSYQWNDGSTTQTLTINSIGTYTVTVYSGVCSTTDDIVITEGNIPAVNLGADTTICDGIWLDAGVGYDSYLWNNSATSQTLFADSSGLYAVTVYSGICSATDEILISEGTLQVDLGPDTITCDGIWLDAGSGYDSYLWNNSATSQTLFADSSGLYAVTVYSGICSATDEILISEGTLQVDLGPDTITCDGIWLDAGSGYDSYLWNDNSTAQTLFADTTGIYTVQVSLGICSGTDQIYVQDCLGLEDQTNVEIKVYPNPTSENVVLEISDPSSVDRLVLTNVQGQELIQGHVVGKTTSVRLPETAGVYFLILYTNSTKVEQIKVVKK